MGIMKKIGLGVAVLVTGLFVWSVPALAQSTSVAQPAAGAQCAVAENNLKLRLSTIQTLRETRTEVYQTILDKADDIIKSAKDNGASTTKLTAAKTSVQSAFTTDSTNATNYETSLRSAQDYACNENDNQFTNALVTARTELTSLRASSSTLKAAVLDQLVPAIKDYAKSLTPSTSSTESN